MTALRREIRACLVDSSGNGTGAFSGSFVFPPAFTGFQGHFPDRPVLPAVCTVQAVLVLMAAAGLPAGRLENIVSAKWFAPVAPGVKVTFEGEARREEDGRLTARVRAAGAAGKIADLTLRVATAAAGQAAS